MDGRMDRWMDWYLREGADEGENDGQNEDGVDEMDDGGGEEGEGEVPVVVD